MESQESRRASHGAPEDAPDSIRAFFAIEFGMAARRAAERVARELRARPGGRTVRWVRAENYHVTLRFLGQIARRAVPGLIRHVVGATRRQAPFGLGLGAVAGLPTVHRPRVVTLDLWPAEPLVDLAGAVERGVVAAGFPAESRAFRAHMTLGRVRRGALSLADAPVPEASTFEVREVVLLRSRQEAGLGVAYEPLERIALGAFDHPANHSVEGRRDG